MLGASARADLIVHGCRLPRSSCSCPARRPGAGGYRRPAGAAKSCAVSAISTIRPFCMTATRSQIWAATRRSWVMNRMARPSSSCKSPDQLEDLRLHRNVEGRDGLVGHQHVGPHGERPRDADALALAAGELVRIAVDGLGREARPSPEGSRASSRALAGSVPCVIGPSAMMRPTVRRGLREAKGSWNTIWMRRRCGRRSRWDRVPKGRSPISIGAAVGLDQAQHAAPDRRFAGAGFAHEPQGLAAPDVEAHRIGRLDLAAFAEEAAPAIDFGQGIDLEGDGLAGQSAWAAGGVRDGTAARRRLV